MKVTYFSHHSLLEHIVPVPSIDLQGQEARKGTPERWASLRWTTTLRQHSLNLTGMLHLLHLLQCFCLENHTQLSCMVKYWTVFITWGRVQWDRSGPRALLTEACEMYTSVNAFEVEQITIASGCLKTSLLWVFTEMERKMLSLFYKEQRRHSEHILSALSSCPCTHKPRNLALASATSAAAHEPLPPPLQWLAPCAVFQALGSKRRLLPGHKPHLNKKPWAIISVGMP